MHKFEKFMGWSEQKESYEVPRLVVHGTVADLTRGLGGSNPDEEGSVPQDA